MKFIFLLILFVQGFGLSHAKCRRNFVSIETFDTEIVQSDEILIVNMDGYNFLDKLVISKNGQPQGDIGSIVRFSLNNKKSNYPLEVIKFYKGDFKLYQFVLKTPSDLKVSNKKLKLSFYISKDPKAIPVWTSSKEFTVTRNFYRPVKITDHPQVEVLSYRQQFFGCGPSRNLNFKNPLPFKTFYKAIVKNSDKVTEFYGLSKPDNTISIGHGMCSGSLRYKIGDDLNVGFSFMNRYGTIISESKSVELTVSENINSK